MIDSSNPSLFDSVEDEKSKFRPLAYRARPSTLDLFVGQTHIFKRFKFLRNKNLPSIVLWGPPGTGKTTLANILALESSKNLYRFSAVLGGVNELKKLIAKANDQRKQFNKESIIFIDEIHRFNKAQQDALLPYVEDGSFTLIGATTENPRSSINRALLSRIQTVELKKLEEDEVKTILENICKKESIEVDKSILEFIADYSKGDARNAINYLEIAERELQSDSSTSIESIKSVILENCREYDRNKDRHYDVISAFIKSLRGSSPDAALLWLAIMVDGGEDPVFIARRLVIFASEDIGNADPSALTLTTSALTAVQTIGMPEARIILAQAVTYLAATVKSNACYEGINRAMEYVESQKTIDVPHFLKNFPPREYKGLYKYPHSFPGNFVDQKYTSVDLPNFYNPSSNGREKNVRDRLNQLYPGKYK